MGQDAMSDLRRRRADHAAALREAVDHVVRVLSGLGTVWRVSVFGSYARGRRDLFTDLDVLVVMETGKGFVERLRDLYRMLDVRVDLDLLCYTPEEWRELKDGPFLRALAAEEVVLYEKKPA